MKQYLELLNKILSDGVDVEDRTGIGTRSVPGYFYQVQMKLDEDGVVHGFPLLTTKKVFLRGIFEELMWKLRGETNIASLVEKNVHIWSEWPFRKYLSQTGQLHDFEWFTDDSKTEYSDEWKQRLKSFEKMVVSGSKEDHQLGELGPTYGHQMRSFGEVIDSEGHNVEDGFDQLADVAESIICNPSSRRIIMSLWNPIDNESSLLPPCPCFYQFFANHPGELHLNVYQRSCDTFLGVPFNDAQDALLLILMSKLTGRRPGLFSHCFGDVHIYKNHIEQVKTQLSRQPRQLPSIKVNRNFSTLDEMLKLQWEDIELIGYDPYPTIKAPIAV